MASSGLLAQAVPQNLYYKFNEGTGTTTANDASPGVGTATASWVGSTTWLTPGHINNSMNFNAGSMATGWVTNIGTGDWTIEFWLRVNGGQFGYACGDNAAASWRMFTAGAAGTNGITMRGGGLSNVDIAGAVDGTWHHIAIVHDDAANTVTAYLDGTQVVHNTAQNLNITGPQFYVGGHTATSSSMVGAMDEFRFWTTARTVAEIQAGMNSELPLGPTLTVSATAGTAQTVFANEQGAGGSGIEAGMFTIDANNQTPACTLTNIELTASGTGDDSTAFSEVRIYRDHPTLGTQGVYDPADEFATNIDTFTTDDGVINFTVETAQQGFSAPDSRDYFVVVKMASSAQPGDTFDFTITDITVAGAGLKSVPAGATMTGLIIDTPQFVFTDTSPTNVETVFLTFTGVCQVFTLGYPNGPDDKPGSINVNGLGTADESTDLVNAQLWWDSDNDTLFDDTLDTQVDTQVFTQDNGLVTFSLATLPDFQAGDTRRFFVVYLLNTSADDQETFQCYISDMGAAPLGGTPVGLPSPSANGTPGLEVSAAILFGNMYGPAAPLTVDSNASDVLLADVGLDALPGGDWGIDTVTFNAGGTGNHNFAYAELALYEDMNANGTWDGAGTDTLAAPIASGFVANSVSFDLTLTTLLGGDERRFFLVAAYNGTAAAGETFGARLTGFVAGITPPGGSDVGFPTPASTAVVIDVAVLSVANGPNQPEPATHAAGAAGSLVAASFRLNALNGATTVNGIDLTTSGTGDWSSDVDSTSGVQIYHDDGDGVFDAGTDTLLAQAGGAALVTATFTAPLNLAVGEIADLWVVIGLTATAGQGIAATPETFNLSIANTTDVSASAPVEFGMPAPNGITVGAIEFSVTNFDPVSGLAAGGQALIISGSGFMAPFSVTIGGTPCLGTSVIAGGTQVTGLTIPPGFGDTLPIVVQSGDLPPQTLTQTFTYTAPKDNAPPKSDDGGSCSAGTSPTWYIMLAVLGMLAVATLRRRVN